MSWVGPPRGASRRVICLLSRIDGYSIFETDARNRLCIVARFFCRSRVPLFIRGRPSSQMVPIETDDEVVTVPPLSRVSSGIVSHCPAPPEREGACVRTCWKAEEELLELIGRCHLPELRWAFRLYSRRVPVDCEGLCGRQWGTQGDRCRAGWWHDLKPCARNARGLW